MRRTSLALFALAFLLMAGAAEAQTLKIGYINSAEILATAPGATEAQDQFDAEVAGYQVQIQQMEDELRGMEAQLQQQQLTLSPEAKANREAQLQTKLQEYQQTRASLEQNANDRRVQLVQPIMDGINTVIEEIRVEGNYAIIFDAAAGSIIAADETLDLTQEVLRRLAVASDAGGA